MKKVREKLEARRKKGNIEERKSGRNEVKKGREQERGESERETQRPPNAPVADKAAVISKLGAALTRKRGGRWC